MHVIQMFYANVLLHGIGFDPRFSFPRNMALTIDILSGIEKQGLYFTLIVYTKSKREKNLKPYNKTHWANKRCWTKLIGGV
jgi:hypothetical protein